MAPNRMILLAVEAAIIRFLSVSCYTSGMWLSIHRRRINEAIRMRMTMWYIQPHDLFPSRGSTVIFARIFGDGPIDLTARFIHDNIKKLTFDGLNPIFSQPNRRARWVVVVQSASRSITRRFHASTDYSSIW